MVVEELVPLVYRHLSHLLKLLWIILTIPNIINCFADGCGGPAPLSKLGSRGHQFWGQSLIEIVCCAEGAAPGTESRCKLQDCFFPECVAKGSWFGGYFRCLVPQSK